VDVGAGQNARSQSHFVSPLDSGQGRGIYVNVNYIHTGRKDP